MRPAFVAFTVFVVLGVLLLAPLLRRYGSLLLLSSSSKRLLLSPEEHRLLVENHNFVVIGGPHRGGTTLLWRLLASHPLVSGFAESGDTDFSEGSFLQTVLPTFGVGAELLGPKAVGGQRDREVRSDAGLGRYGFAAASHMTEHHKLNSNRSAHRLLCDWAYHWNLSRPILLEKTPTDMLTSRLLQALLVHPSPARVKVQFLFITRHPLAVALAHRRWLCCRHMTIESLVSHWVHTHRVLAADIAHLRAARVVRYEDLAAHPREMFRKVLSWLRLPPAHRLSELSSVASDTNRKYEQDYCQHHLGSNDLDHRHCRAALALQPPVAQLGLGYDVLHGSRVGFACIAQRIAWHGSDNLGDESGTRTGSGCDDQAADPRLVQAMRQLILEDRELKQQDKGKLRLHARLGDAILGVGPNVLTKQTLGDYTWAHPEPQELTRPEQTTRGGSGARPAAR